MPLFWSQLASLLGPPGPMAPQVVAISSPTANASRILLRAPSDLTISRVDAVLSGGTSPAVSFSLRHGSDVSATGTAVTTEPLSVSSTSTGTAFSSFHSPAVLAEHWLWLEITASSGSPQALTVAVQFS
jgi:hypothetical protein